jgi:phosphoglycerate dehydrogenase-like enzyme
MNSSSVRTNVLFLAHPPHLREPWLKDVREALGSRHDLKLFDEEAPCEKQFADVDVVVDQGGAHSTRAMADASRSVRLWQILGTGFEKFDLTYWQQKKIPVANTPGQFSAAALGECALMFMLMLARRWHETQASLEQGLCYTPMGRELEGARLLLIGFGASARALAKRAFAIGMRISAMDVRDVSEAERREFNLENVGKPADIDRFLTESDYVSLHLHLNAETRHILDARRLSLLPLTACLVNVARGPLVDEEALYQRLAEGRLGGAALDVFASEPVDPKSPLLKLPNVIATPHISGNTDGTSRRRAECVATNVDRIARGLEPLYRIDI